LAPLRKLLAVSGCDTVGVEGGLIQILDQRWYHSEVGLEEEEPLQLTMAVVAVVVAAAAVALEVVLADGGDGAVAAVVVHGVVGSQQKLEVPLMADLLLEGIHTVL